jgi:hypothetical protein
MSFDFRCRWLTLADRILTAPYEERGGWDLNVMYVDGVLYFEEHLDDARLREKCVLSLISFFCVSIY